VSLESSSSWLPITVHQPPEVFMKIQLSLAVGWIFTIEELVPFIDNNFHTLRHRESRALAGEMMGGRGALIHAMKYPDYFSVVYAMNPVGTGRGYCPFRPTLIGKRCIRRNRFLIFR